MSNKYIKPLIIVFTILLLMMLWIREETADFHAFSVAEFEYLNQEKLIAKELDLQVNRLNNTFTINYDDLNKAIKKYEFFHKEAYEGSINKNSLNKLKNLIEKKLEQIDYFKRSNSIIHNSSSYLYRHISDETFSSSNFMHSTELTKRLLPLFRLLNEYKSGNHSVLKEIDKEIQKLQSLSLMDEKSKKAYERLILHANTVLNEGTNLRDIFHTIDALNDEIFALVDISIDILKKHEISTHENYDQYERITLLIIFIMILLIYYFTARLIKQENEIKQHAFELENKIKEATQSYRMQNEIYQRLFYDSSDGVLLAEGGLIIDCNNAMLKMLGYSSKKELINQSPSDISPEFQPNGDHSAETIHKNIHKLFSEGPQRMEWVYTKTDGRTIWTDVILTPITANNRNMVYAISRDLTDRKELELKLESMNIGLNEKIMQAVERNTQQAAHMLQQSRLAQMGEMISMIAHQWRQPLASISAIAGTLTLDVIMDQYKKEFFHERLEAISELSQHLSSTIDDFRGFFKEEKELKNTSLLEIVHSSLQIIGPTLRSRGIEIDEKMDDIILMTYPNEIIQVLLNLLKNAEEAFEDQGIKEAKISIYGYRKDDMACLSVEDNAGGIPEEIINKVFDPYFSTKTKKDGTGLGLYMSKTIIEEHCGGELQLYNIEKGTCFIIVLPLEAF